MTVLDRAIAAAGGRPLWSETAAIEVTLDVGGAAWPMRMHRRPGRFTARVETARQRVEFLSLPRGEQTGLFEDGDVSVLDPGGSVAAVRRNARAAFGDLRHKFRWDDLDLLYFSGYALWNYICTPFMFERPGFELTELEPWENKGERLTPLAVTFPDDLHTHSREQVFHYTDTGLLRRHDYTAEPFGGWARAAHRCVAHRTFDGYTMPVRRRVQPKLPGGAIAPLPVIVSIRVESARRLR